MQTRRAGRGHSHAHRALHVARSGNSSRDQSHARAAHPGDDGGARGTRAGRVVALCRSVDTSRAPVSLVMATTEFDLQPGRMRTSTRRHCPAPSAIVRGHRARASPPSCMLPPVSDWDVIVVGAGNAALAAAVSAREQGARRVLALEKAPRTLRGGNTHYSGGLLRIAFDHAEDLRPLVPQAEKDVPGFFVGVEPYPHKLFMADLLRVTDGCTDPELAELLIGRSYDTAWWMAKPGIGMEPAVSLS